MIIRIFFLLFLVLTGCARTVTQLNPAPTTLRFSIYLSQPLGSQQILIDFSPVTTPSDFRHSNFIAQSPSWYQEGPNEVQQSKLDALTQQTGRFYGITDSYYQSIFQTWSDYVLLNSFTSKLVNGPFTSSANIYSQTSSLQNFSGNTSVIQFTISTSALASGTLLAQSALYYNVFLMDSNGIVMDLFESNPSPIILQSGLIRSELDSDTFLIPSGIHLQKVEVQVQ